VTDLSGPAHGSRLAEERGARCLRLGRLDLRIPGRAGTRSVKPVIAACRPVHLGAEPDAFAYPARTKATAARARTVRCSPGSDLCEVELPNTLRCTGHAHATTPRYRPHAGNGPLRPSVAPGEDYAALQTSQTPAACRCRAQIAAGSGPFARRPAHPWREPGEPAVLPRRPASRPLPDLRRMYSAAGSGPRVPRSRHHRVPCRTVFRTEASCPFRRSPSTVTTAENGH
jgi:hypothetical protein